MTPKNVYGSEIQDVYYHSNTGLGNPLFSMSPFQEISLDGGKMETTCGVNLNIFYSIIWHVNTIQYIIYDKDSETSWAYINPSPYKSTTIKKTSSCIARSWKIERTLHNKFTMKIAKVDEKRIHENKIKSGWRMKCSLSILSIYKSFAV